MPWAKAPVARAWSAALRLPRETSDQPLRSDQDDSCRRMPSRGQRPQHIALSEAGQGPEGPAELVQNPPVRARVGNGQKEMLGRIVAALEREPAFGCLDVSQPH